MISSTPHSAMLGRPTCMYMVTSHIFFYFTTEDAFLESTQQTEYGVNTALSQH